MLFDFLGLYPYYGHKIRTCSRVTLFTGPVEGNYSQSFCAPQLMLVESLPSSDQRIRVWGLGFRDLEGRNL